MLQLRSKYLYIGINKVLFNITARYTAHRGRHDKKVNHFE